MSEQKWTNERWEIARDYRPGMSWNNHIICSDRPNITVCFMSHSGGGNNTEFEAKARLIAAAPALANALQREVNNCPTCGGEESLSLLCGRCKESRELLESIR